MENLQIYLIMALLGYAAFVFIAESFNPFSKNRLTRRHGPDLRFRHWIGVLSGLIIGLSAIATRVFPASTLVDQLKVCIIAALVVLLPFLLLVGLIRFVSRRDDDFVDRGKASVTAETDHSDLHIDPNADADQLAPQNPDLAILNQQQEQLEQQQIEAEAMRLAALESQEQDDHLAEERRIEALRAQEKQRLHEQWEEKQAIERQKQEQEKLEQARLQQERLEREQRMEQERLEQQRLEQEQLTKQEQELQSSRSASVDTAATEMIDADQALIATTEAQRRETADTVSTADAPHAGGTPTPELLNTVAGEITVLQDGLTALRSRADTNEKQVSRLADLSDEQIRCQRQIDTSRDELEKVRHMQVESKEREVSALKTQQDKRENTIASMQRVIELQKKQITIAANNSERQQNLARQAANVARQAAQQRQQAQRRAEQEKVARQKMEQSAKRAVVIARDAVTKLAIQERGS